MDEGPPPPEQDAPHDGTSPQSTPSPILTPPDDYPLPPSLRSPLADNSSTMTASSTPLGQVNAARRPSPLPMNQDIQAKMKAFTLSRQGAPMGQNQPGAGAVTGQDNSFTRGPVAGQQGGLVGGIPPGILGNNPAVGGALPGGMVNARLPPPPARPLAHNWSSAPAMPTAQSPVMPPTMGGLAAKRGMKGGMKLSDVTGGGPVQPGKVGGGVPNASGKEGQAHSAFTKYSDVIDTKAGSLNFRNKAVIHGGGIDFTSGRSFNISLDEVDTLEELGKGNYGTVYRVRHARPRMRRPGLGLRGAVSRTVSTPTATPPPSDAKANLTNVIMAMKEIRLELDESKFTAIIMELDILHRCVSPFIIDFYGAFFQEGAVYICVEYMDGGSVEKLYGDGIPENILRKITLSTIMGLKCLKDEHNIIHRDVKPTNILINSRGQVKICDFGVSGNLVASIAKTNIGCQSYMAPERIAGGGGLGGGIGPGTYSVQSDIWSLGLTIVECAMGRYPYPPETYNNIFSQLNAIVQGEPPCLPEEGYSEEAKNFVCSCLNKNAALRPTYAMLLRNPWLLSLLKPPTESETQGETAEGVMKDTMSTLSLSPSDTYDEELAAWVRDALDRRARGVMGNKERPPLHAVALDAVPGSPLLEAPSPSP
ncbi:STE/STE7 protein kinase [Polytolypa hystricis UAMH7299]|uniref:mitogen-activated protein kinase kinase n=1 Tax=Polytolypa hystricis (strain UAMH7299) TaxID=1447883 RepID=A0A2B7YZW6_POLH7|nr:STE/STE7 protein kinase [Polytolypa hystricis UAMH7299]